MAEANNSALRDFVEQAQYICEKPTLPEVHDIDRLRSLGKLAFPLGFKKLGASAPSLPTCEELARKMYEIVMREEWHYADEIISDPETKAAYAKTFSQMAKAALAALSSDKVSKEEQNG